MILQKQFLKFGIRNSSDLTCFAANSRVSTFKGVVRLRFRTMGSKRLHSKLSASPPGKLSDEEAVSRVDQNDNLDLDTIEKLTVQQLRVNLRTVGIPARGSKAELVSNWKNYLNSQKDGKSSLEVEDQVSSDKKHEQLPSVANGLRAKNVSEISGIKKTNKRIKEVSSGNTKPNTKTIQLNSTQEQSIEYLEVSGKRSFRANRNVSSEVCTLYKASEAVVEPWTLLAHKKPQKGWVAYNPRTMRPPPLSSDTKHLKLMSWNVNGLRALLKLESFSALELAKREDFDVLCLQETKLQEKDVEAVKQGLLEGYNNSFWTCSVSKLGYSGTAVISRVEPLSVRYGLGIPDHDTEGRLLTVEFDNFYLLSGYVPNSGDGLKRLEYRITQWDPALGDYIKELEKSKPVILTGDLNCAHEEIDIYNPAGNRRSAGFTDEERQSFETNFLNRGFVDTFRRQHPGVVGYTYWGYRHGLRKTNKGWRLDYFLISEAIADYVHDSYILPDVSGSDHSPIGLILKV